MNTSASAARWLRSHWRLVVIGLCAAAALSWNAWLYLPFMADDSFISLRYAQRLLTGNGLTWTQGERVEGYSNLLWVLGCALLGALGCDLIVAARLLGWLSSMAVLSAVVYRASRSQRAGSSGFVGIALLTLCASGPIAVWTIGGLEQPLAAGLLCWACVLTLDLIDQDLVWMRRRSILVGVLLGLLCWTRPDAPLFVASLLGALVWGAGLTPKVTKLALRVGLVALGFLVAQLAFRLVYYGQWVANTALVKLSWTAARRQQGWEYVTSGLTAMMPISLLAVPGWLVALRDVRACRAALLLGAPALTWCTYLVLIGGDIFPAHRHLVMLMPLLALMILQSDRVLQAISCGLRRLWFAGALGCFVLFAWRQFLQPENQYALGEHWEWDGVTSGRLLRKHFGSTQALMAVDAAGSLVYFSGLPAIDMLGLNDRYLAQHPPEDFGKGRLGHELGDGQYVLRRKPDLVVFNAPTGDYGGIWRSGREMTRSSEFHEQFRHVLFETDNPRGLSTHVFVRVDGRAGFRRDGHLIIPGYFWGNSTETRAREDGRGRLGAVLHSGISAKLLHVRLPNEPQAVVVRSSGEPVTISLTCGDQTHGCADGPLLSWKCEDTNQFTIEMRSRGHGLTHVREVEFVPCAASAPAICPTPSSSE